MMISLPMPSEPTKKLKVFILSNDDLTSNLIFAPLFDSPHIEVTGVAFTLTLTAKNKGLGGVFNMLKKMDARYWLYLVYTNGFYKIYEKLCLLLNTSPSTLFRSIRHECKVKKIPVYHSSNFNTQDFCNIVLNHEPDLLLIRVNQILKQDILNTPKLDTWCIHSSLLPSYKGIAAEFHALNHHEPEIGSSLFRVILQLDQGAVLMQDSLPTNPKRSVFFHMLGNNQLAGSMLKHMAEHLAQQGQLPAFASDSQRSSSYYSWPQVEDIEKFHHAGGQLLGWKDAITHFFRSLMLFHS